MLAFKLGYKYQGEQSTTSSNIPAVSKRPKVYGSPPIITVTA